MYPWCVTYSPHNCALKERNILFYYRKRNGIKISFHLWPQLKNKIFREKSILQEAIFTSGFPLQCYPQPRRCSRGHEWLTGQGKWTMGRHPEELACAGSAYYFPASPGQVSHKGSKLQKTWATLYNLPSGSSLSLLSMIWSLIQYPRPFNSILNLTWYKRLRNYLKSYVWFLSETSRTPILKKIVRADLGFIEKRFFPWVFKPLECFI